MTFACAVYGYECTIPARIGDFELIPRFVNLSDAREHAREQSVYNLTALLMGNGLSPEIAFQMEAILSFIEHLDVIVTEPVAQNEEDAFASFPTTLPAHQRHDGGGAMLMSDVFFGNSRATFIGCCLRKLSDAPFNSKTKFADLLYRKVETFRQRRPLLEISYYLLFSGLESHARAVTSDRMSAAAVPMAKLLKSYGFNIDQERPDDLPRAVSTYSHIRNALFHNSELEALVKIRDAQVTLRVIDYYSNLHLLVSLVVFKAIEFDDGHVNWDCWIDRQPFK